MKNRFEIMLTFLLMFPNGTITSESNFTFHIVILHVIPVIPTFTSFIIQQNYLHTSK